MFHGNGFSKPQAYWFRSLLLQKFISSQLVRLHKSRLLSLLTSCAMYGDNILPALAHAELVPKPTLRRTVGNNSVDSMYRTSKAPATNIFPSTDSVTRSQCRAKKKKKKKFMGHIIKLEHILWVIL